MQGFEHVYRKWLHGSYSTTWRTSGHVTLTCCRACSGWPVGCQRCRLVPLGDLLAPTFLFYSGLAKLGETVYQVTWSLTALLAFGRQKIARIAGIMPTMAHCGCACGQASRTLQPSHRLIRAPTASSHARTPGSAQAPVLCGPPLY